MSRYEREIEVAGRALREAADLCQQVQRSIAPEVLKKKDKSPVTVADFGSQAMVCRHLAEGFSGDPVVAEEDSAALRESENAKLLEQVIERVRQVVPSADTEAVCRAIDHGGTKQGGERFWTLDPIDGTKGFLRGEQYAIVLALIVNGHPEVAALACPNLAWSEGGSGRAGKLFFAVRDGEAWVESIDDPEPRKQVCVSSQDDPAGARVCESVEAAHSSHGDAAKVAELLGIAGGPVRLDSQAKYGVVASGEAEIYLRLPTRADYREKIWDHAAGALLVATAGGRVTDVAGKPLEFHHGRELTKNRGVIATNGVLHERVLEALKEVGVGRDQG